MLRRALLRCSSSIRVVGMLGRHRASHAESAHTCERRRRIRRRFDCPGGPTRPTVRPTAAPPLGVCELDAAGLYRNAGSKSMVRTEREACLRNCNYARAAKRRLSSGTRAVLAGASSASAPSGPSHVFLAARVAGATSWSTPGEIV